MSVVTTVTIISHDYDAFEKAIEKLNAYICERYDNSNVNFKLLDRGVSAGTKYPQREMVWGGFNYLDHKEFVSLFKSLDLDDTIMIFAPEESGEYQIFSSKTDVRINEL